MPGGRRGTRARGSGRGGAQPSPLPSRSHDGPPVRTHRPRGEASEVGLDSGGGGGGGGGRRARERLGEQHRRLRHDELRRAGEQRRERGERVGGASRLDEQRRPVGQHALVAVDDALEQREAVHHHLRGGGGGTREIRAPAALLRARSPGGGGGSGRVCGVAHIILVDAGKDGREEGDGLGAGGVEGGGLLRDRLLVQRVQQRELVLGDDRRLLQGRPRHLVAQNVFVGDDASCGRAGAEVS